MLSKKSISRNWLSSGKRPASTSLSVESVCLQVVDLALLGVIFVAPLFFGGRHDLGRFVLVLLCAVLAVAWSIRQAISGDGGWNRTVGFGIVSLAVGFVGFQLIPLPTEWIATLAPRNLALLSSRGDGSLIGEPLSRWSTLSLAPDATRLGLATLVAYGLLFLTVTQKLRDFGDIERLLRWIAMSAVMMACFGLIQYFTSNGRFFWIYEVPFSSTTRNATGSFSCRNHFAHFLVLGLAPLIAWTLQRRAQDTRSTDQTRTDRFRGSRPRQTISLPTVALIIGTITVVLAVMLSFSRGGALALACVASILSVIYLRYRLISTTSLVCSAGAIAVVVLTMLSVYGYDKVTRRLDDFASGSVEELDSQGGRRKIWTANVAAFRAGWRSGAGVGSHRYIYPAYLPESHNTEYTHAENGPLQILTENGLPGALLLTWGIGCCGLWCARALKYGKRPAEKICAGAVTAALMASLVHSSVDFVWFIPACMTITILLACCALRLAQICSPVEKRKTYEVRLSRPSWIGLAVVSCLAGLWSVSTLIGPAAASLHWDRYLLANIASKSINATRLRQVEQDTTEGQQATQVATDSMIIELRHVIRAHPTNARAHLRLAGNYLRQFELRQAQSQNQMSITQIRDAAMMSHFSSSEEMHEWLVRAFGRDSDLLYLAFRHARCALKNCPLQGEAYIYLASLCFLEGKGPQAVDDYVAQALRVNPYSGDILFAVGLHEFLSGRLDQALQRWQSTFAFSGNRWGSPSGPLSNW